MAAKTDMERIGVFSESGYTTISAPYTAPSSKAFNESAAKGKQMVIGGTKSKTASQSGYFDATFNRILQGEAFSDPVKLRRKRRLMEAKKNLGSSWVPSSCSKQPSGVGSHYGTFAGPVSSFSAASRPKDKYKAPGKNFLTNPGKIGTGYGYVGVTIGPTSKYSSEPYDRSKEMRNREHRTAKAKEKGGAFKLNSHPKDLFDENPYHSKKSLPPLHEPPLSKDKPKPFKSSSPAKVAGGCKAGTFDVYPKHSEDPYTNPKPRRDGNRKGAGGKGGVFRPSPGPKSMPTSSVVQQNVIRKMNTTNFQTVTVT
jgi:hypothetical protein